MLLLVSIFYTLSYGQDEQLLRGEIIADSLQDASVHIVNITRSTGTLNSASGTFEIKVEKSDTLWFTSVQYEKVEIVVTEALLQKERISVKLREVLIPLAEVNISNLKLTGNLKTDSEGMEILALLPPELDKRELKNPTFYTEIPSSSLSPENSSYEQNRIGEGKEIFDLHISLDLIAGLFKKKPDNTKSEGILNSKTLKIRKQFNDNFFLNILGIDQNYIVDFLFYLDEEIERSGLMIPTNSLTLTELLIVQSNTYKTRRAGG